MRDQSQQHVETVYMLKKSVRGRNGTEMFYTVAPTPFKLWQTATQLLGRSPDELRALGWRIVKASVVEITEFASMKRKVGVK